MGGVKGGGRASVDEHTVRSGRTHALRISLPPLCIYRNLLVSLGGLMNDTL